jgi:hypothetical protein
MGRLPVADKLEVLGLLTGGFLVLVGLGTLSGLPWETAETTLVGITQALGGLLTIAVGVGLAWLTRTDGEPA